MVTYHKDFVQILEIFDKFLKKFGHILLKCLGHNLNDFHRNFVKLLKRFWSKFRRSCSKSVQKSYIFSVKRRFLGKILKYFGQKLNIFLKISNIFTKISNVFVIISKILAKILNILLKISKISVKISKHFIINLQHFGQNLKKFGQNIQNFD